MNDGSSKKSGCLGGSNNHVVQWYYNIRGRGVIETPDVVFESQEFRC